MRQLSDERGLTLIELLVGMGIAAFLLLSAVPFYTDYARNSRLREAGNALLAEALFAQSEAIKLNATVRVSINGDTLQVIDRTDPLAEVVLRERTLPGDVAGPVATLDYGSEGRLVPFGTSASINLASATSTCSADARCPGLRVDAGGATRLCGNYLYNCP